MESGIPVIFKANGLVYKRDKNGDPIKGNVLRRLYGKGVVKSGPDMLGKVFRQCPKLTVCDSVSVVTYNL